MLNVHEVFDVTLAQYVLHKMHYRCLVDKCTNTFTCAIYSILPLADKRMDVFMFKAHMLLSCRKCEICNISDIGNSRIFFLVGRSLFIYILFLLWCKCESGLFAS